ncbi:hypothetical protein EMIT0215P_10092 [Pseudomonas serboccidentalis]
MIATLSTRLSFLTGAPSLAVPVFPAHEARPYLLDGFPADHRGNSHETYAQGIFRRLPAHTPHRPALPPSGVAGVDHRHHGQP